MLEDELFKKIFAQPSLGTNQPAEVSQVVTHLLESFTSFGSGSPGSHRCGGLRRQNPVYADPKGPGSDSSP